MKILLPSIKLILVAPEDIPRQPRIVLRLQWSGNPEREKFVKGGVETIHCGDVMDVGQGDLLGFFCRCCGGEQVPGGV